MHSKPYYIEPSEEVGNYTIIHLGSCQGQLVGGNLCTLNLLQGTEYMPSLNDKVLFIEDNYLFDDYFYDEFDRNLQSLLQVSELKKLKGVIFGRFRNNSKMNIEAIKRIVSTKKKMQNIPILYNVDFGHVLPVSTVPVGGIVKIVAENIASIQVVQH